MKKLTKLMMVTVLLALITGCQDTTEKATDAPTPLVITSGKQSDENYNRYSSGEDINNNPMIQLGIDKLGIQIKYTTLGTNYSDYIDKLRLALTGAEELPDVIPVYDRQLLGEMIQSGQVKALDQDIEDLMPERLKAIYQKNPATFDPLIKDGQIYGLPIAPCLAETQTMVIRQDWLDKLGLQAPTTIEEFETVIKAFSEQDPDGNGKRDTYGFSYSGDGLYSTGWMGDPAMLFSAYTGKFIPGNWEENSEGHLTYGSLHEGNQEALAKMAEWHQKGWLQPNAGIANDWNALVEFRYGKSGIYVGRSWSMETSADIVLDDQNARLGVYPTIRQADGQPTYQRAEENDGWFLFSGDFDQMEAFFQYYDWLYDLAFGTGDFQFGYLENIDYDIVDGQPVFDQEVFDPPKTRWGFDPNKALFTKNRIYIDQMKAYYDAENGVAPKNSLDYKALDMKQWLPERVKGGAIAYEHQSELTANKFRGSLPLDLVDTWNRLEEMEHEIYTKIIYGELPPTAFQDFVTKWYQSGGEEITAYVDQWYQQTKAGGERP